MNQSISRPRIPITAALLFVAAAIAGCGGGGGSASANGPAANPGPTTLEVRVKDVTGMAIQGATVTLTAGSAEHAETTDAEGIAEFADLPAGETALSISAAGFESATIDSVTWPAGPQYWDITLDAEGAWAVGRAILLGTRLVERSDDGSAMTFSADLAVIDENLEALQTLTSADFSVLTYDCGWGGPRDCASDAEGNDTGNFSPDGGAQAFELRPAAVRHPYLAGVLVERSSDTCWNWDQRAAALKSYFEMLGGNDVASLMTVQTEKDAPTLAVHGPFTSDASAYLDVVDGLSCAQESPPALLDALSEAISITAMADGFGLPDAERHVLVLASVGLTASEVRAIAELARESGVHVSSVPFPWNYYGVPEAAVRTGGFVSYIHDLRQLSMVFGVMDRVFAGTLPFYRMQFHLAAGEGTFVPGGNVKVRMRIDVPTPIPNRGVFVELDVALL